MPEVHVNGCDIYYEVHGQRDPLVMIMGLRRNLEWWYHQIPVLSKHFEVIAFDNRGAGRSDKPEMDYSIRLFADDTAALMDELGIDLAHVLGVSMGGYIAQELAINHSEKVIDLVLGCTSCGGEKAVLMKADRLEKFTANEGLTPEEILQKDMDIYFSDGFIEDNSRAVQQFSEISMRYYQPADAFERQFAACMNHDTASRLHRISQPILIMSGDDDPLVPPENSYILEELLPEARLSVFPKGYRSGKVNDDTVPTFAEMLTRGKDRILFKLDLKCEIGCLARVLDELDATDTMRQVMIRLRWPEIDPDEVKRIVSSSPKYTGAVLMFRVNSPDEASEAIETFQPPVIEVANPEHELSPEILEMIRRIRESGARVEMHAWGEPPDMQPLIDAGVGAFHSDRPRAMIRYLRETGQHW